METNKKELFERCLKQLKYSLFNSPSSSDGPKTIEKDDSILGFYQGATFLPLKIDCHYHVFSLDLYLYDDDVRPSEIYETLERYGFSIDDKNWTNEFFDRWGHISVDTKVDFDNMTYVTLFNTKQDLAKKEGSKRYYGRTIKEAIEYMWGDYDGENMPYAFTLKGDGRQFNFAAGILHKILDHGWPEYGTIEENLEYMDMSIYP